MAAREQGECLRVWFVEDDDGKTCRREPLICSACIRAIGVEQWGGISRHYGGEPVCVLCGIGPRDYCSSCAIAGAVAHRGMVHAWRARPRRPPAT